MAAKLSRVAPEGPIPSMDGHMPEDEPLLAAPLRGRPWRSVAAILLAAIFVASVCLIRRSSLRQDALQLWTGRSSAVSRLISTSANGWVSAREGDTRLIALNAGRSPQIFVPIPGKPPVTAEKLAASLVQTLTMLDQLHRYTAIWLFDNSGKLVASTSAGPPAAAVRNAAMAAISLDSGDVSGPYRGAGRAGPAIAFARRVAIAPATPGAPSPNAGRVVGSLVLTSDATSLLSDLAAWSDRSGDDSESLIVAAGDSVFEFALTPNRMKGTLRGAWEKSAAPELERAAFAQRADTNAYVADSVVGFAAHMGRLPWGFARRASTDSVFASVDGRLSTEVSTGFAIIFMVVIVVIARRQTTRERKLLEVAESEVRYRLLADNSTDVIIRHAPDGRIVYASPAVMAILGYQPRQLQGRHPSELSSEDDPMTMAHVLEQLRTSSGAGRAEHRLRHADGHYVWLETTGRAVRDPVWSNVTELVTVSRDIEARKEAEEALRASEEEYRVLFEANPVPMWAFDADTYKFLAVNAAAVAHYGYSHDEFLEMTIFDIRPPEDEAAVRRKVEYVRAGFKELHGSRHKRKDGTIIDVDLTVHPVKLGDRTSWLVLVKDVTEAMRTANALRASNEFVRALFDSSPVAIIATDLDLRVVQWNGAAQRLFGWTSEEVIGKRYPIASEATWPEVQRNVARALRDGRFTDIHVQRCRKDGSPVDLSLSAGVVRNAEMQANGFVVLAADLSERARLEAQLRHAQKMDAVGQLAGGVAHDFNNLLTVVTGYAGLLLAELSPDDPIRADIAEIKGAADRAAVLTRQLLAFSRQQMLEPTVLDLNVVVEGMEQMVRRVLPADIRVTTVLDPLLGAVNADQGQLEQVLMNLIVNARDAMSSGGTLMIETMNFTLDATDSSVRAEVPPGDYVMLAVSDSGCGMSREVQARIFEPFFTTKDRGKGTGLGLSTAHGIVTQSGGFLSVYSELALGTTVKVCLPRIAGEVDLAVAPATAVTVAHGAEVVLLVEDDMPVRIATTRMLERAGYTVITATHGREALDIHKERGDEIDLIITDMIMPEMSGRDLVARVRERDPFAAVLVMSGYTEQTSRSASWLDAATIFIQKPFTPESLTAKVRSAINSTAAVAL